MKAWRACRAAALLASLLLTTPVSAKKDGPDFHVSQFPEYPANLNYFENSDVILFQDIDSNNVFRSTDAGASWERVDAVPDGAATLLYMHEYDSERAYILTTGTQHWRTHDRGETWDKFQTDTEMSMFRNDILQFHAEVPDRILFNAMECQGIFCEEVALYTTDGFRSTAKFLRANTNGCWWAKSSRLFTTGDETKDKNRILCIARDSFSLFKEDQRLFISDNFFAAADSKGKIDEFEPNLDTDKPVSGIVNVAMVKKFLLAATNSDNTDEMALFVSDDTIQWHRAMFPTDHRLDQDAYTVLESTDYSIQIDVQNIKSYNPMGVMFTSNSNGTYFTRNFEHTNRNGRGLVDFEKIANIQGIFLLNSVKNWEEVEKSSSAEREVITEITFDDGRTFEEISADGKRVHLHSVTELSNIGKVFSSPAPGLVMGIGNTGDHLKKYSDGNLYVSDNAGKTWIKGLEGPHKYEFGDQGSILVAVKDSKQADITEIKYSLDHGQKWLTAPLPDGTKIRPWFLTTTQDSTSLKFILVGESDAKKDPFYIISIDFDGLHEATCKSSDLEDWFARVDDDKKPTCLMGHTQKFQRRKKDAECFMKAEHKKLIVDTEDCECTDADFECDYNFVRDSDRKCVTKVPITPPEGACKDGKPDDTFLGPSGYRKIPGNTCKRKSGKQMDDKVERKCSEATSPANPPATGKIDLNQHIFKGDWVGLERLYLERGDSSTSDDETIIVRTVKSGGHGPVSLTRDHGKTWEEVKSLPADDIAHIIPHHHFKEMVFFITNKEKVYYTPDRGQTFHSFKAPLPPKSASMPLAFHPDHKNWLIWMGEECEHKNDCRMKASISEDRGENWKTISWDATRCEFIGSQAYSKYRSGNMLTGGEPEPQKSVSKQILCLEKPEGKKDAGLQLVASNDYFDEDRQVVQQDVLDFRTMAEFIVAAIEDKEVKALKALSSLDGRLFASAHWPYNFEASHQKHAYTLLDSSTHALNLFVVTEFAEGHQYGSIMKSNSNGTNFVQSIEGVNCNGNYYVDFEKMLGLEGVALVNVVVNKDEKSGPKKLQSRITHNDGAEWTLLPPPKADMDGKSFCTSSKADKNQGDENCALHIHGYTERVDHKDTFSSKGAVGLMFGWGNVGNVLGSLNDADTFMTTDAGITWKQVQKGRWTWAIGDQGAIIVLVQKAAQSQGKTKFVYYSIDEGTTWQKEEFSEDEVHVAGISTLVSGGSRNFLLYGKRGDEVFTVNIDFSGLSDRECKHDDQNPDNSDYYVWSPKHPLQQNDCFWGHVSEYLRKKPEKTCYNPFKMEHLYRKQDCECSRQDYECDYNYQLGNHGACKLVEGLQPMSHELYCKENPDADEYWEPTGYRRLPLTTCEGGDEFDKMSVSHPCPGKEEEYERKHSGPTGFVLFLVIVLPFAIAGAIGWYLWRNWVPGVIGQIGQIRLGEQPAGGLLDEDRPWVRYPIVAVSAVVAVVGALPLLASAVWRTAKGAAERWGIGGGGRGSWSRLGGGGDRRFTTRDSFARGRADYTMVDDDEGELLGDDSDEEVV